jgi:hypothetical protein
MKERTARPTMAVKLLFHPGQQNFRARRQELGRLQAASLRKAMIGPMAGFAVWLFSWV